MRPFIVGSIAAGLWIAVIFVVWLIRRDSPGPPRSSIRRFRFTRHRLDKITEPLPIGPVGAAPIPLPPPEERPDSLPLAPASPGPPEEVSEEIVEVEQLIESIAKPQRPRPRAPARKRPPAARKAARASYIVVDEKGRPIRD